MIRQGQPVHPVVIATHIRIDLDCTTGAFTARQAAAQLADGNSFRKSFQILHLL
ncbi:MAG: hypothetical protein ACP5P4_11735 [Steroidobacteraceae bacterium]